MYICIIILLKGTLDWDPQSKNIETYLKQLGQIDPLNWTPPSKTILQNVNSPWSSIS